MCDPQVFLDTLHMHQAILRLGMSGQPTDFDHIFQEMEDAGQGVSQERLEQLINMGTRFRQILVQCGVAAPPPGPGNPTVYCVNFSMQNFPSGSCFSNSSLQQRLVRYQARLCHG